MYLVGVYCIIVYCIPLRYYEENRHHRQTQPGQNEANGGSGSDD